LNRDMERKAAKAYIDLVDKLFVSNGITGDDLDAKIGKESADLYRKVSLELEGYEADKPSLYISVTGEGVKDVASDDWEAIGLNVYVIDETLKDDQGVITYIDTQDGSHYKAAVKRLTVTPVHFDEANVKDAIGDVSYANGMINR